MGEDDGRGSDDEGQKGKFSAEGSGVGGGLEVILREVIVDSIVDFQSSYIV